MDIKAAVKLLIETTEANYDQGELEEDEPELAEALVVAKKFISGQLLRELLEGE